VPARPHARTQGALTGTKTLTVRNWFPGTWYVRERRRSSERSGLFLFCQTEQDGWTDVGKVRLLPPWLAVQSRAPGV
jgi:hypothetical protein